jgi:hypothetical protein
MSDILFGDDLRGVALSTVGCIFQQQIHNRDKDEERLYNFEYKMESNNNPTSI